VLRAHLPTAGEASAVVQLLHYMLHNTCTACDAFLNQQRARSHPSALGSPSHCW
jgi:hypothetical protein